MKQYRKYQKLNKQKKTTIKVSNKKTCYFKRLINTTNVWQNKSREKEEGVLLYTAAHGNQKKSDK